MKEGDPTSKTKLQEGFGAIFYLCRKAAEGNEGAKLALGTIESLTLIEIQRLKAKQENEALRQIAVAIASTE
tara:strand:+ start:62 stop:277 length:216 start_codon:yes stop_codon:yes gene_type:complete